MTAQQQLIKGMSRIEQAISIEYSNTLKRISAWQPPPPLKGTVNESKAFRVQ